MSKQEVREEVLLNMRCIVKGYHLCRFEANAGEVFTASENRGERGKAFKVVNHRGQLSHLQSELVDPHWPLHANASQDCDSGSEQTTESSCLENTKTRMAHRLLL